MIIRGKNLSRYGAAAVVVFATSSPGLTQDGGGVNANLSLSQGIESSSDDGTFGSTNLGFTLSNVTPTQDLQFQISTGLEEQFSDGIDADVIDPRFNLSYGIQNRQSALDISARYRRADVDSLTESDDPLSDILILDSGTRERAGISLGYMFGREARFGGMFNTSYDTVSYSGTTSSDLVDLERIGADFTLRFEITPRIAATLGYDFNETDRAGSASDVRNTQVRAGADLTVSETLTAGLSVGFKTVESTGAAQDEDGITYALNLRQDRPNGALTFNLNTDVSETGRQTNMRVGTTFETRNGSEFAGSVGLNRDEDGNTNPLYELSYSESLRQSSYTVFLNQDITTSDLGQDTLNSRIGLTYNRELTPTTSLQSGVNYQTTDFLGLDKDTSRLNISLGVSRELTQDWSVTSRYTHTIQDGDLRNRDTENRLFLGLETNFGWRP